MRTAVIYSGQARTFARVYRNQYFHVLRKLPNPEFFICVADDFQAKDMFDLREFFPEDRIHLEYVKQPTLPEPPDDPPFHNIYPRDKAPIQDVLRQLWALDRAYDFFCAAQLNDPLLAPVKWDLVVRIRPDLAFGRFEFPSDFWSVAGMTSRCWTPYWARWGGVNDRLAVMGPQAALSYFRTFHNLPELRKLGCPLHPEQLIHASMREAGVQLKHTLPTEFITVRLDGSFVPMSMTEIDKVEYARSR